MENGTKKTIIWESNSEPPKNYIWAKPDGSMVEYNENTKSWNNSTSISGSGSTSNNFTITTIPESNGAFTFASNPNAIYELVADQFTAEDFSEGNDLPDAFETEETAKPYILLANERLIQKLGLTKEQFIALNNEGSRVTVQGLNEQMNDWTWVGKQKTANQSLPELPAASGFNYECMFGDFQNQDYYIRWTCSIDGTNIYIDALDFCWNPIIDVDMSNPTITMSFNRGTSVDNPVHPGEGEEYGTIVILTVNPSEALSQNTLVLSGSDNHIVVTDITSTYDPTEFGYDPLTIGQRAINIYMTEYITGFRGTVTASLGEAYAECYLYCAPIM